MSRVRSLRGAPISQSLELGVYRDIEVERRIFLDLPTRVQWIDPPNLERLYPYQVLGVEFLRERKVALLADAPGVGKTAQALRALSSAPRVIVVCPASLRRIWRDQVAMWRPELQVTLAEPGEFYCPEENEVLVVSYDSLPYPLRGVNTRLTLDNLRDVYLILDEIHRVKSDVAERSFRVRLLVNQVRSVWGLTGTPLIGTLDDFRGVLRSLGLLAPEGRPSKTEIGELQAFVAPYMLRRLQKEVLHDLPPKRYKRFPCEPPAELVEEMDAAMALLVEYGDRLPPFELLSTLREALARHRIPELLELVAEHEEQELPLVVFSAHVEPLLALENRPGWGILVGKTPMKRRSELVKQFQAGELKGLACSMIVAGVGFTITRAAHAIFASLSYSPADNEQAEDRLVRIGQKAKKVLFTHMIADHPLEHRLLDILAHKDRLIDATIGKS